MDREKNGGRFVIADVPAQLYAFVPLCLCAFLTAACMADTFTNRQTGSVLHGYITSRSQGQLKTVQTVEHGAMDLDQAQWEITQDRSGRSDKVIVLTIDDQINLEMETIAMEEALVRASDMGPLFIILQIDTPGGRTDCAQRICSAIVSCPTEVAAFVMGGPYGGAISAGTAVAFACDKVFMAPGTIIGAAAVITLQDDTPKTLEEVYGHTIEEKVSSAWRAYLASLAESQGRPALLARAMVDEDISVVEVTELDHRIFIDPIDKLPTHGLVRTWSEPGHLLTMTAQEAVACKIADAVVADRSQLMAAMGAAGVNVESNDAGQQARRQFNRVRLRVDGLAKSLDLRIKQFSQLRERRTTLKALRQIKADFKSLVNLSKRYPDLHLNTSALESQLNSVETAYRQAWGR